MTVLETLRHIVTVMEDYDKVRQALEPFREDGYLDVPATVARLVSEEMLRREVAHLKVTRGVGDAW